MRILSNIRQKNKKNRKRKKFDLGEDSENGNNDEPDRKRACIVKNSILRIWNGKLVKMGKDPSVQDCNTLLYGTTMVKVNFDKKYE